MPIRRNEHHGLHRKGRRLSPSDHPENQGYNGNYEQNMNQPARTVNEKSQYPSNDQNNRDDVQQAPHNFNLKVKELFVTG
jgi:hypothetical protein